MTKQATGYIYVLTNESFHRDNWIKIGYAEDVEKRVKELSGTSVPLPYEVYCTYEIPRLEKTKDPDKLLHDIIQSLNPNLRITQNREFFEIAPWDAYQMLEAIAKMHGRLDKLRRPSTKTTETLSENSEEDMEYTVERLFPKDSDIFTIYSSLVKVIKSIDPCFTPKPFKLYVAFSKNKKYVATLWPKKSWIEVVLASKRNTLNDPEDLTYDISNRKWSSSQYAIRVYDDTDLDAVKKLIEQTASQK
ncbi:MAG: GIY-YIG nuclease family protein [Succinivibrio sp.]|nr:GIY-YIG nuclease family protein [Succinivibrio sp.]